MHLRLDRFHSEDMPAVLGLLADNGLPADGLREHLDACLVLRLDNEVVACAALEFHEDGALLRSVAVREDLRGNGLGNQIVKGALELARLRGTTAVYLLTTTAEGFFPRFGFRRIARTDVPPGVQTSVEFQSACPASAVVMATELAQPVTPPAVPRSG
jgi:amino-acid N-acetyltransferase